LRRVTHSKAPLSTVATIRSDRSGTAPVPAATFPVSARSRVRRDDRASYDRDLVHAVLDEALVCHVAFAIEGQPFVVPMVYGRVEDTIYLHGSPAGRLLRHLRDAPAVSVEVTLLDGLVLARSASHHSCNYRSVVLFGRPRVVRSRAEKEAGLRSIVEHATPGRWDDVRGLSELDLRQTRVIAVPIEEASAKVRVGPPVDDPEDLELPTWAGVVPVRTVFGSPSVEGVEGRRVPLPQYLQARIGAERAADRAR
jgi:nitroimidazol reductase NimA-like FMN-containing flavoprotein (pyridoxamine 5'-phosphate oxidase superfamily)